MRIRHPLRTSLTACLGLSGLALAAGCSVAPAGATSDSAAIGPVRSGAAAKNFAPFPVAAKWNGVGNVDYRVAVKAKTGANPHRFDVKVAPSLVFWLGCMGAGTAHLTSPAIKLNWAVTCGDGSDPQGLTLRPPPSAQGKTVKVLVTAPAGGRWEIRVDAPASAVP